MVTIEGLLPYSYWIGHPVSNRAIVYLFVGYVPFDYKAFQTLKYILYLNQKRWERKSLPSGPGRMRIQTLHQRGQL